MATASISYAHGGRSADLNADGVVDALDVDFLLRQWRLKADESAAAAAADLDRDGVVGQNDLSLLLKEFGEAAPGLSPPIFWVACQCPPLTLWFWTPVGEPCPCTGTNGGTNPDPRPDENEPPIDPDPDDPDDTGTFGSGGLDDPGGGGGNNNNPPPPPPPCAFDIVGPRAIRIGDQAAFSVMPTEGGSIDSVEWDDPGSDLIAIDPSTLQSQTVQFTAGETLGVVTLTATVTVGDATCMASVTVPILDPHLKSIVFVGDRHNIVQDTGLPYAEPHWLDEDLDGDAEDMGDRRFPVAYTRGSVVTLQQVRINIGTNSADLQDIPIRGVGPDGQEFEATASTEGEFLVATGPISASQNLPNTIRFYNPYVINWAIALDEDGEAFQSFGQSDNRLYVTLNDPQPDKLYETVIDIAVRNANGLNDAEAVVEAIYDDFRDRSVARKAMDGFNVEDGAVMQYWAETSHPALVDFLGFACQTMSVMIDPEMPNNIPPELPTTEVQRAGTCVAWSDLLHHAWQAHGITDSVKHLVVSVYPTDVQWWPGNPFGARLLVRNWTFMEVGTSTCPNFPYRDFIEQNEGSPGDECVDVLGVPAQGGITDPPPSFFNHFITLRNGVFYDPSYGSPPFATHAAWENASLSGFTKLCDATFDPQSDEAAARKNNPQIIETALIPLDP